MGRGSPLSVLSITGPSVDLDRLLCVAQTPWLCLQSIGSVFDKDVSGADSLQVVRHLNRMIKSCSFVVNPAILSVLLRLRLRDNLGGFRASGDRVERIEDGQFGNKRKDKGNKKDTFLNKKARKALKDKKQVEREINEAEASVKREEIERNVRAFSSIFVARR
jgi:nucleolar complex protein 3